MKSYKTTKPFILSVIGEKNPRQFAKNQVICVDGNKLYVQGRSGPLKVSILDNMLVSGKIIEVSKQSFKINPYVKTFYYNVTK